MADILPMRDNGCMSEWKVGRNIKDNIILALFTTVAVAISGIIAVVFVCGVFT